MAELHDLHKNRIKVLNCENISFNDFVQNYYEKTKKDWLDNINHKKLIDIEMNDDGEVDIESAKIVLKEILSAGINAGMIKQVVLAEELAPDYNSALLIADAFWEVVMPAVEKSLKDLTR